ncbi:hypothetical protein P280DRAFT_552926 [Massarina eburnea CBS 473.64]|uniref:Uncharacterized protein n=1 Tax=Massarina eburnea CBS 473.64 TaxID=1395130 RepID=A0A6A6RQC1_9PLEO|nr:hypothetical protein P280DRAFT_552926 [Massarina eburnea CBS 473.64]
MTMTEHLLAELSSYSPSPASSTYTLTHNDSLFQPRKGIFHFLRHNTTTSVALLAGTTCVVVVTLFTAWLSKQIPQCPSWAIDCEVPHRTEMIYNNMGLVQGLATALYSIGLAALAFFAHAFSEAALWPILHRQQLSLKQIDTYLDASRGSIPASPMALVAARSVVSVGILLITVLVTLLPLTSGPVTGRVYDTRNITVTFKGHVKSGGGIGPLWRQKNPPLTLREGSSSFYTSWQSQLSQEPMPAYRDWFIDRHTLSSRGNFTAKAVRAAIDISCRGWEVEPTKYDGGKFEFETDMIKKNTTKPLHDGKIHVRDEARLAVWAHNYTFDSITKTTVTVIFAALNGTIPEGKAGVNIPKEGRVSSISSVACDIGVELVEDTLVVGDGKGPAVQINSLHDIKVHGQKQGAATNYNELNLWFAAAIVANGAYAYGVQPMYSFGKGWIPARFTTTLTSTSPTGVDNEGWNIDYIKNMIRISTGASMLGDSISWSVDEKIDLYSHVYILKMDPRRTIYLTIAPLAIVASGLVLMAWNMRLHRSRAIPIMRKATLSEVLKSSQTPDLLGPASFDKLDYNQPSVLGELKVRFAMNDVGVWGLYGSKNVL